jgi:hypothetical protein
MYTFKVNVGTSKEDANLHNVTLDISPLLRDVIGPIDPGHQNKIRLLTEMLCALLSIPVRKVKNFINVKLMTFGFE